MNAPLAILGLTALLSVASFLARRRLTMASLISGLGSGLLGLVALAVSLDAPIRTFLGDLKIAGTWTVLGRSFVLDDGNRAAVSFIFLAASFVLTGAWGARPVRYLPSFGLFMTACVAASLMIRPFLYAAPLLEIAAIGACLLLIGDRPGSHRAGTRLLTFYTLAMMSLLLTGWMLDTAGVTSATPIEAERVFLLLALGLAVLLVVPPFHSWLPSAAEDTDAYTLVFVVVILQSAGLFLLLGFLNSYAWLRESAELGERLRWAGLVTVGLATLWAAAQRDLTKFVSYALLADVGVTLLLLGRLESASYQVALGMTGSRTLGLAVWAMGIAHTKERAGDGETKPKPSAAAWLATSAGALSIAGAPLTAGFPGRWASLMLIGRADAWAGGAIAASIVVLVLLALRRCLALEEGTGARRPDPVGRTAFLLAGIGLILALGSFPQLLYPWVIRAAEGLANLIS